jgi:hypothetical protein
MADRVFQIFEILGFDQISAVRFLHGVYKHDSIFFSRTVSSICCIKAFIWYILRQAYLLSLWPCFPISSQILQVYSLPSFVVNSFTIERLVAIVRAKNIYQIMQSSSEKTSCYQEGTLISSLAAFVVNIDPKFRIWFQENSWCQIF